MRYYSNAHYRRVSPPRDTPEEIAWRLRDNIAREQAWEETLEKFSPFSNTNAHNAMVWFEARRKELLEAA